MIYCYAYTGINVCQSCHVLYTSYLLDLSDSISCFQSGRDTELLYHQSSCVNTADYLGSVIYKVNDLLDEKVVQVSGVELQVSCT